MNRWQGRDNWKVVRYLCVLLVTGIALFVIAGGTLAAMQPQPGDGLALERSVDPESGLLGEAEFTVSLTLSGLPDQCPQVTVTRPQDIVLVLDRSGSMEDDASGTNDATKLDLLKEATKTFVEEVDLSSDRIAIVQFDDASNVVQGLSDDQQALSRAIDSIDYGGGTSIDTGVLQAFRELQSGSREDAGSVMIVFTDGQQSFDFGLRLQAQEAKNAGVRIITVGLGRADLNEVDADLLRSIASQASDAYLVDDAEQLTEVYETIARSVVEQAPPATDIVVDHQFNGTSFELVPGSLVPDTAVVNGSRISWTVSQVLESPVNLSYRVRPRTEGTSQIDLGDTVSYNLCGQTPSQFDLPAALSVVVQEPTPTPSSTPLPTPTASVTPSPSPTAAPTWTPTPALGAATASTAAMAGFLCDTSWLNWLLVLSLLLFFIWWIWRVLKTIKEGGSASSGDRRGCICQLCKWIPWLAVPLTLILLWLVLTKIDLCPIDESLYYWRIDSGISSNGGIYVTDPDGLRPAEEFRAVNQGASCVGCHAVSSSSRQLAAITEGGVGSVVAYNLNGEPVDIPPIVASFVSWSPSGDQLAIADSNGDIQILHVESQQLTPLQGASDPSLFETMPTWSHDGQTIAFVRGADRQNNFSVGGSAEIFTVPAIGGSASPVVGASGGGFNYYPAYSPDGQWLAFTHHTDGSTTYAAPEAEIFLMPATGGIARRLAANDGINFTPLQDVSNSWPTWSLDGTKLAFTSKRNDPSYDLFITEIDADGNSGGAFPVPGAAVDGVFEHLPFWGLRPETNPWNEILGLWPFLLLYLLLALLYWLCKKICPREPDMIIPVTPLAPPPEPLPPVQLDPLWQVAPTLLVGVGGTGRWTLTHLKKSTVDGGFGVLPDNVRFALIDTSEREDTNVYFDASGQKQNVSFAGTALDDGEVLLLGPNLSELITQTKDASLAGWFPYDNYSGLSQTAKDLAHGTEGRRPMARAGLIKKLREGASATEPPLDAAGLWQFLRENSEAVRDGRLVRVVLVGSMAGGMSGVMNDMAYLIRRAAESILSADGTVHLEGYFTTDGPYRRLVTNATGLRINTLATALELQRFQLSGGLPYTMDYLADMAAEPSSEQIYLREQYDRKLYDEVVVFGNDGHPEYDEGKSNDLWATTFATMADVLALRLDRATAAGTNNDYRAGIRRDAETKQTEQEQVIVSTAGSYAIKLPLVDMLHIVHTRWARKLYHVFLMGSSDSALLSFDPNDAGMEETPNQLAQKFLMGQMQNAPAGISAAGNMVAAGTISPSAVRALGAHSDNGAFRVYLREALGIILNGSADRQQLQRRAPQLGYATRFAQEVQQLLAQAAEQAQTQAGAESVGSSSNSLLDRLRDFLDLGTPGQQDWQDVSTRLAEWRDLTRRSYESLHEVQRLLNDDKKDTTGQTVVPGLYSELNRRQVEAEARRKQMDQVAVRRYLWTRPSNPDGDPSDPKNQQDLVEEWYAQADKQLANYLERFYWQVDPDGSVQLSLFTYQGKRPIRLDDRRPETVLELADELSALAVDVTKDIATSIRLGTVLPTMLSTRQSNPEESLVSHIWQAATPTMRGAFVSGATIPDYQAGAVAGIPEHVQRDERFDDLSEVLRHIERRIPNNLSPTPVTTVGATDATTLSMVRSFDLMPLFSTPEMLAAWETYARNAGSAPARMAESPLLATVFRAEEAALEYARRLEYPELLNEDFRRLHPMIVFALQRPDVVKIYALALAAGWLIVQNGVATLKVPGQTDILLKYEPRTSLPPLVGGLLQAVMAWAEDSPPMQALQAAINSPSAATTEAWRTFIDRQRSTPISAEPAVYQCEQGHPLKQGQKFCGVCGSPASATTPSVSPPMPRPYANEPQMVQDLAAVATLEAYHQLTGADQWVKIVMPEARRT